MNTPKFASITLCAHTLHMCNVISSLWRWLSVVSMWMSQVIAVGNFYAGASEPDKRFVQFIFEEGWHSLPGQSPTSACCISGCEPGAVITPITSVWMSKLGRLVYREILPGQGIRPNALYTIHQCHTLPSSSIHVANVGFHHSDHNLRQHP